jgi:hypothetical protein
VLEQRARVRFALVVGVFQQHAVRRVAPQRHAQLRVVLVHQAQGKLAHHLEARQARAQVLVRQAQQATAACIEGTAAQAVSARRGAGTASSWRR